MNTLQKVNAILARAMWLSRKTKMSQSGIRILILLRQKGTSMRVTELADHIDITQQAVGKTLRHMEEEGFITSCNDNTDHRAKLIDLHPKGVLELRYIEEVYSAKI